MTMAPMEPEEKLRVLAVLVLIVGGLAFWLLKPAPREQFSVPQATLDAAAKDKGRVNERKFAKEGEGGSYGTTQEAPGGADMERLGLAKPEPPAVSDEMKAKGIGPIGSDQIH